MKNKKVILTLASLAVLLSGCKNTTSSSTSGQNSGYVAVTDLSVDNTSVTIGVNMTKTLTATVSPVNATDKDVTFSSVDSSIAAVSSSGILTGISEGKTLIVVTAGGKTKTVSVTVTSSPNRIGYAEKTGTFKAAWSVGSSMFMLTNNTFYSPLTFQYQTRDNVLDLKDPHVFLSSSMDGVKNGTVSVAEQTYKNYEAMVNATSFTDILDGTLKSFVGGLVNRKGLLPGQIQALSANALALKGKMENPTTHKALTGTELNQAVLALPSTSIDAYLSKKNIGAGVISAGKPFAYTHKDSDGSSSSIDYSSILATLSGLSLEDFEKLDYTQLLGFIKDSDALIPSTFTDIAKKVAYYYSEFGSYFQVGKSTSTDESGNKSVTMKAYITDEGKTKAGTQLTTLIKGLLDSSGVPSAIAGLATPFTLSDASVSFTVYQSTTSNYTDLKDISILLSGSLGSIAPFSFSVDLDLDEGTSTLAENPFTAIEARHKEASATADAFDAFYKEGGDYFPYYYDKTNTAQQANIDISSAGKAVTDKLVSDYALLSADVKNMLSAKVDASSLAAAYNDGVSALSTAEQSLSGITGDWTMDKVATALKGVLHYKGFASALAEKNAVLADGSLDPNGNYSKIKAVQDAYLKGISDSLSAANSGLAALSSASSVSDCDTAIANGEAAVASLANLVPSSVSALSKTEAKFPLSFFVGKDEQDKVEDILDLEVQDGVVNQGLLLSKLADAYGLKLSALLASSPVDGSGEALTGLAKDDAIYAEIIDSLSLDYTKIIKAYTLASGPVLKEGAPLVVSSLSSGIGTSVTNFLTSYAETYRVKAYGLISDMETLKTSESKTAWKNNGKKYTVDIGSAVDKFIATVLGGTSSLTSSMTSIYQDGNTVYNSIA